MKIDHRGAAGSVHRPANRDAAIMSAVIGRKASAIWNPVSPTTSSRYRAVKKNTANVAK